MECSLGNGGWGHSPQKQALFKPLCKTNLSNMKGILWFKYEALQRINYNYIIVQIKFGKFTLQRYTICGNIHSCNILTLKGKYIYRGGAKELYERVTLKKIYCKKVTMTSKVGNGWRMLKQPGLKILRPIYLELPR